MYKNIYFIGIGGIGMSAIARYYNAKGFAVSGYDKTPSPLTEALEAEGIEVHYTDDTSYIPKDIDNTLVVYTPAIPKDMGELVYVQENGYRVIKRSKMLGEIAAGQRCMAVAGTSVLLPDVRILYPKRFTNQLRLSNLSGSGRSWIR